MQLSVSFLSIKKNIKDKLKELDEIKKVKYFHVDIMDGLFVSNKTRNVKDIKKDLKDIKKPLDVHLMVKNIDAYYESYKTLKPEFITIHLEATNKIDEYIKKFHDDGIKIGLSIKPSTKLEELASYLSKIDLVLVMSVEPGSGGQTFINETTKKLKYLSDLREINNYKYLIEVDGGINNHTISKVMDTDIVVIGSYITNSDDYKKQIETLGGLL